MSRDGWGLTYRYGASGIGDLATVSRRGRERQIGRKGRVRLKSDARTGREVGRD
jgi:hypothetical protein